MICRFLLTPVQVYSFICITNCIELTFLSLFFFRLFPFPTAEKRLVDRQKWKQLINRKDDKGKLWSPSKDSRVCSLHFRDRQPTVDHPYPTENLGYDSSLRVRIIVPSLKRRKLFHHVPKQSTKNMSWKVMAPGHGVTSENHSHETSSNPNEEGCSHCESEECKTSATLEENSFSPRIETLSSVASDDKLTWENHSHEASYNLNEEDNSHCDSEGCDTGTTLEEKSISPLLLEFSVILLWLYAIVSNNKLQLTLLTLTQKVKKLEWERKKNFGKICELQRQLSTCTCKKNLHMTLLRTDKDTKFFTRIDTKELFNALHDYIAPFVQRRWKGAKRVVESVRRLGKKRGPERKLDCRDEF